MSLPICEQRISRRFWYVSLVTRPHWYPSPRCTDITTDMSGILFLQTSCWVFQKAVYIIYADYVMKNPFYELDMPIKVDLWESHLRALVSNYSGR